MLPKVDQVDYVFVQYIESMNLVGNNTEQVVENTVHWKWTHHGLKINRAVTKMVKRPSGDGPFEEIDIDKVMKGQDQSNWEVYATIFDFQDRFPLNAPWGVMQFQRGNISNIQMPPS